MTTSRRTFLGYAGGATSLAVIGTVAPSPLLALRRRAPESLQEIRSPEVKQLVQQALDVARSSGADYADVRFTHQRQRGFGHSGGANEVEEQMVGIRVLVNGFWGFASGVIWHPDAVAVVAREAVRLARANSLGKSKPIELAPVAPLRDEHWVMPVESDPFEVSVAEMSDIFEGIRLCDSAIRKGRMSGYSGQSFLKFGLYCWKQQKAFGSTDGNFGTQVFYRSGGVFQWIYGSLGVGSPEYRLDFLSPAGAGLELFTKSSIHDKLERSYEKFVEEMKLPVKPTDIGRYDVIMDPESVARLASGTLGAATELDRALGEEANQSGTSYLNAPSEMAGTFQVGGPLLTVTANRTDRGAVGTMGWDDEGVRAGEITLIDKGIVRTFQTTRESAAWLHASAPNSPLQSSGCACAMTGDDEPITQTANLTIQPGPSHDTYEIMLQNMEKGIAFENANVMPDFQQLSGVAWGRSYEIRNGKKTAILAGAATLFRTPELWKSLTAVGGVGSTRRFGMELVKGEPVQQNFHSVLAPPLAFKEVTVVDVRRKA